MRHSTGSLHSGAKARFVEKPGTADLLVLAGFGLVLGYLAGI